MDNGGFRRLTNVIASIIEKKHKKELYYASAAKGKVKSNGVEIGGRVYPYQNVTDVPTPEGTPVWVNFNQRKDGVVIVGV